MRIAATLAASAALVAGAVGLATANVAAVPQRRPVPPPKPAATPVFVPRTDLKVTEVPIPTPIFATYRSLPLYLPVKPKAITLIAFHQAGSKPVALHLRPLVTIVKASQIPTRPVAAVAATSAGPDESAEIASAEEERGVPEIYGGRVLRLWRTGRTGEPDTAVDVGAKPGTPVIAPVSGTIAAVRRYRLYGEYEDYELHILPRGWDVDCCILHVNDPKVRVGDTVVGGVTRIATVRWLSQWFGSQLDEYTHDGGNHVHVQIDRLAPNGKVQLMGGLESEFGVPRAPRPPAPRPRE
jgi:murein DD-endopeptidase MepM/ murein hydrolase activator NlpD